MGAGLFLTRDREILSRTFHVETAYMPKEAAHLDVVEPHAHSMQWSRRFIGLKLLLSLAVAGWNGYADSIRQQFRLGDLLRDQLVTNGWTIVNPVGLPVVCFTRPGIDPVATAARILNSGSAWISSTIVGDGHCVLRACITNFRTTEHDVRALVDLIGKS